MRGKVLLLRRGTLLLILTALVAAGIFMAVGGPRISRTLRSRE